MNNILKYFMSEKTLDGVNTYQALPLILYVLSITLISNMNIPTFHPSSHDTHFCQKSELKEIETFRTKQWQIIHISYISCLIMLDNPFISIKSVAFENVLKTC